VRGWIPSARLPPSRAATTSLSFLLASLPSAIMSIAIWHRKAAGIRRPNG